MTSIPSYAAFLVVFVGIPIAMLVRRGRRERRRHAAVATGLMVAAALAYTTPWDNYLIGAGVWWYGDGAVTARIWLAPVEEYLFIALQPVLAALWIYHRGWADAGTAAHDPPAADVTTDGGYVTTPVPRDTARMAFPRVGGALAWLAVASVGLWAVTTGRAYYLGAILAWAAPVLALQWAIGGGFLWTIRRRLGLLVAVPTVYLWTADWLAIELGIWAISSTHTIGVGLLGLPAEEMTFFLVTNLLVVQGIVLFHRVVERWR
ncbi:lycopene cyclase domain-containing protein [Haloarchaeobius sp. FL176]|uniref:lycopene cyclase domain-containing protein n=1 Tax=Haloarchaeobius sp. FL176 TaxID=2967129 RepID=UPI002148D29E|nr:lycopene cyclase domain-containing protein [Haloarchaeobius sp. FL176]